MELVHLCSFSATCDRHDSFLGHPVTAECRLDLGRGACGGRDEAPEAEEASATVKRRRERRGRRRSWRQARIRPGTAMMTLPTMMLAMPCLRTVESLRGRVRPRIRTLPGGLKPWTRRKLATSAGESAPGDFSAGLLHGLVGVELTGDGALSPGGRRGGGAWRCAKMGQRPGRGAVCCAMAALAATVPRASRRRAGYGVGERRG